MHLLRLAVILPAILTLGGCAEDGMGGRVPSAAPLPAPVTPGRVTSSNPAVVVAVSPSANAAAAAAAANAAGAPPV